MQKKYLAERTFAEENVSVFQGICNILQDASRFQHGIQLHIYSVERHVKPFYFKKIKDLRVKINVRRFTQS